MMKTKEDYLNELKTLSQEFLSKQEELIKLHDAAPEKIEETSWPQYGDDYWNIDNDGYAKQSSWWNHITDMKRLAFGNVFRTESEATKELAYLKFERDVRAKAKELNGGWVADWGDSTQRKYIIEIEPYKEDVIVENYINIYSSIIRGMECKSREAAQALLKHFGADKFLAYATGGEL